MDPLPLFLLTASLLLAIAWPWLHGRTRDDTRVRAALQALLTVITPSCSLWPSRYTKLVKQASISPDNRIMLPLHIFVHDVLDGVVEVRDPLNDLVDLIRATGINANGWNICLSVGLRSWVNALGFCLTHKLDRVLGAFGQSASRSPCDPLCLLLCPVMPTQPSNVCINLDYQPFSNITEMKSGTRLTLEFTSISPVVQRYSTAHVIATLPFVLSSQHPLGSLRLPRNLTQVLGTLADKGRGSLTVHSATNLSTLYSQELLKMYRRISEDVDFRKMLVDTFGVQRWRHQRFYLAFEAALVRQGLIEKWAIQVSKQ